jgi:hypothetical protein
VLELKVPHGANLAALWPLLPVFMKPHASMDFLFTADKIKAASK